MTVPLRPLRIAAHTELVSLLLMLANLATVHLKPLTSLLGPAHGCAYLFVVLATWRLAPAATATKATAVVPGIGGLLVLRSLSHATARSTGDTEVSPGPERRDSTPACGPRT
ncbi:DUF3817 domain-containing protein [Streptomyces decoyicus]|uniref:DUF3817 domain-containing protein n=1 Tax=Streptomyces decoyicus TaxID=249567 RepID=UPI003864425B|nr:DUF3817 domain-containing protein [Streptomyces decoyicus]